MIVSYRERRIMKHQVSPAGLGLALVLATGAAVPAKAAPSARCDTETVQAMAPAGTTVAFAQNSVPKECLIDV